MKKELGIDIDGCLNCYHGELRTYINLHYGIDVPANEYYVVNPLNLSPKQEKEFWEHYDKVSIDFKPEENCKKIIDKLSQFFNISIITARNYNSAGTTEKWLQKSGIYYDNVYFNSGDKWDVCNWKSVRIMVEDNPDNAMVLAQNGVKVLLFDRLYNRDIKHENIIRCRNWNQIYNTILLINR